MAPRLLLGLKRISCLGVVDAEKSLQYCGRIPAQNGRAEKVIIFCKSTLSLLSSNLRREIRSHPTNCMGFCCNFAFLNNSVLCLVSWGAYTRDLILVAPILTLQSTPSGVSRGHNAKRPSGDMEGVCSSGSSFHRSDGQAGEGISRKHTRSS